MAVKAIRLQNFMAFEDTDWIELRPITLLLGRNSSGKSAIIRALRLLKQSLDAPDGKGPFIFESLYGIDLGLFTEVVHGGSEQDLLWFHFCCASSDIASILATLELPGLNTDVALTGSLQLSLGYAAHRQDRANLDPTRVELVDLQIRLEVDKKSHLLFQTAQLEPEDVPLLGGEDWYVQGLLTQGDEPGVWQGFGCTLDRGFLPKLVPPIQSSTHYQSLESLFNTLKVEVTAFLRSIIHLGPIRPEPERRYSFDRAKEFEWRQRGWGAFLDYISGDLKNIQEDVNYWIQNLELGEKAEAHVVDSPGRLTKQYEIGVTEAGATRPLSLSAHGFGISQVLPIIVQCLTATEGSIVLIEQSELHLHPRAQAELGDLFIAMSQRGVRFLIETHSEHLLLRLRRKIAESTTGKVAKENQQYLVANDLRAYFVDRIEGASHAEAIRIDSLGKLSSPSGFRGFFADDLRELALLNQAVLEAQTGEAGQ